MSKRLSRRSRDFFTGIPNIYSASPDSGAPVDYVRAVSSHLNEVELPQSPRTESGRIIPPIVTHLSCLPISPDSVYLYFILPLRSFARLRSRQKPGRGRAKDRPITPPHAKARTGSASHAYNARGSERSQPVRSCVFLAAKNPFEIGPDLRRAIHALPGRFYEILAGGAGALFGNVPEPINAGTGVLAGDQPEIGRHLRTASETFRIVDIGRDCFGGPYCQ